MKSGFERARKKYKLPKIKELEEMFDLSLKPEEVTLKSLRNDIADKLYDLSKMLETLIFSREGSDPDILFIERMILDLTQMGFVAYKKLNSLYFSGIKLKFEHNEKKDAEFIKTAIKEWAGIEETALLIFERIEQGWKNLEETDQIKHEFYHG